MSLDPHHVLAESQREEWLTVREVARSLSVSRRQVWKWIGCSMFVVKRFGPRLIRISRHSLQAFIDKQPAA